MSARLNLFNSFLEVNLCKKCGFEGVRLLEGSNLFNFFADKFDKLFFNLFLFLWIIVFSKLNQPLVEHLNQLFRGEKSFIICNCFVDGVKEFQERATRESTKFSGSSWHLNYFFSACNDSFHQWIHQLIASLCVGLLSTSLTFFSLTE